MSSGVFSMRFGVRIYELDPQLHVDGAYIQYSHHARFACVEAAS